MAMSMHHHHRNAAWLTPSPSLSAGSKPHVVVSNSPSADLAPLVRLWEASAFESVICADGGANRLYDSLTPERRAALPPQFIVGDLDSVRDEVVSFYQQLGTTIVRDSNQDNNDLEKCLLLLPSAASVVVYGAFGGRFDQQMAGIHSLLRFPERNIVLVGDGNLAFLVSPGAKHVISLSGKEGPGCALLPIGSKAESVTTAGLKWNLAGQPLEFGQLISTANRAEGAEVEVETTHPLIWVCDVEI